VTVPRDKATEGFRKSFGSAPDGVAFAPGRVNLIGEHVDYNGGLVLPMPISAGTAVAWRGRADGRINAVALDFDETDAFEVAAPQPTGTVDWRAYLRGMAACMAGRGLPVGGADIAVCGTIPRGAGLSSSASFCIAIGRALAAAGGADMVDPRALSLAAQDAEHAWADVKCGIMDQLSIAAGEPGSAVLIDCRSLNTQRIALPPEWSVMIVQSGVSRGLVDGHYNRRRADCELAAKALGVETLRDATLAQVDAAALDPVARQRARHVVTEIDRTSAAVVAVGARDIVELGSIFAQSHASMRDDFAITVPDIDRLVALLAGAVGPRGGARMTGGGFGGAVVAVMETDAVSRVSSLISQTYRTPAGETPPIMIERCAG